MAFEIYLGSLTSSGFVSGQRFVIWYFPQMITRPGEWQINDHQCITMLLSTFDICSLRWLRTGDLAVPSLRVHPIPDAQISHHGPILQCLDLADQHLSHG